MTYLVILLVIALIVILFFSKRKQSGNGFDQTNDIINEEKMPRDFLAEASGLLKTPKSLKEMIEENKEYVISKLLSFLEEGGIYERKYAAFALGQIGNDNIITQLRKCLGKETVQGVQEALEASLTALNIASAENGHSELDRRTIIDDVYNNKRPKVIK